LTSSFPSSSTSFSFPSSPLIVPALPWSDRRRRNRAQF
jgi:hypothetical protein